MELNNRFNGSMVNDLIKKEFSNYLSNHKFILCRLPNLNLIDYIYSNNNIYSLNLIHKSCIRKYKITGENKYAVG